MTSTTTQHPQNFIQIDHPVLAHHLTLIRKKETPPAEFKRVLAEMGRLVTYEATRDLEVTTQNIETPMESYSAPVIASSMVLVAIMRAGMGMLEGACHTLPFAQVGHIGIYRDKNVHATVEYFFRVPEDLENKMVLLVDPLLASGQTALAAIQRLKEYGARSVRLACVLACQKGLNLLAEAHPETQVYGVHLERGLNAKGYLLPGIGDAGDRLYGTV